MAGKSLQKYTVQESQNAGLGQAGCILIDNANGQTGPFVAFTALSDAVIDTSECDVGLFMEHRDGSGVLDTLPGTITIPKGVTVYGRYESIELDTGSVIAYRG